MGHIALAPDHAAAVALMDDFSIEMTGKDIAALDRARDVIPAGTRINVTYLDTEDQELRVAAAKRITELGFVAVPHISARRIASRGQLEDFLMRLSDVGASANVCVIGGDPVEAEGPFPDALSIIRTGLLELYGARTVSIAGYPEGHPAIERAVLVRHLEDKSAALLERGLTPVLLTQFVFDTDSVMSWIAAVRATGVQSLIRIGVPGPAGIKRLIGFARRFGVGANAMIVKKYGFTLTNLMGTAGPDRFVSDLSSLLAADPTSGDVKLHFYAFGGLLATSQWAREYVVAHRF